MLKNNCPAMKQTLRIALDIAMTVLLLCAYACRITGVTIHKWGSIVLSVLFAVHIFINRHWLTNIFKGSYTPRRIIMTAVNVVIAITATTMLITGILEAVWSPDFLFVESRITIREIHTTAAYWFLSLIGVHLGLHWGLFSKFISRNRLIIAIMRILALLFATFGVWSFFDRDMYAKMFLGFSFDYWPEERPVIFFFVQTLSVMGVFVITIYYLMKSIYWLKNQQSKTAKRG
jgi:hypothetical protein